MLDINQLSLDPCQNSFMFYSSNTRSLLDIIPNLGKVSTQFYNLQPPIVDGSHVSWKSPSIIENEPITKYELQRSTNRKDFETIFEGQQMEFKTSTLKAYYYRFSSCYFYYFIFFQKTHFIFVDYVV